MVGVMFAFKGSAYPSQNVHNWFLYERSNVNFGVWQTNDRLPVLEKRQDLEQTTILILRLNKDYHNPFPAPNKDYYNIYFFIFFLKKMIKKKNFKKYILFKKIENKIRYQEYMIFIFNKQTSFSFSGAKCTFGH